MQVRPSVVSLEEKEMLLREDEMQIHPRWCISLEGAENGDATTKEGRLSRRSSVGLEMSMKSHWSKQNLPIS